MLLSSGMKNYVLAFSCLFLSTFIFGSSLALAQPRTDGARGSEYGSDTWSDGEMQVGLQFGGMFRIGQGGEHSLAAGADVDYRPYNLFGLRASYLHGFQKHKGQMAFLSPLVHGEFANLKPYLAFGPGIARVKYADDKSRVRFAVGGTVGADVMLTSLLGIGMVYQYGLILDGPDLHHLGARLVFNFGSQAL
jgi:hypothetical protein